MANAEPLMPPSRCTHYFCRCMRAAELAQMGLTHLAIEAHDQEVRCRLEIPAPPKAEVSRDAH